VALFPCNECAKTIIQAGIQEVVYMADTYRDTDMCRASRIMFQMAGVTLRQHIPQNKHVDIVLVEEASREK
jgi:dCMP deaminase